MLSFRFDQDYFTISGNVSLYRLLYSLFLVCSVQMVGSCISPANRLLLSSLPVVLARQLVQRCITGTPPPSTRVPLCSLLHLRLIGLDGRGRLAPFATPHT
ncbi:hypothetical protein AcV5_005510 [Taiwanofungus camphoratus]|nr:hypothetical protein AcV5_005510 [Antrodia cinnamomea]